MNIVVSKNFRKEFRKLPQPIKEQFRKRRDLFLENDHSSILHNHSLQGIYKGYRSINITGDYRVIFESVSHDSVVFLRIATHSELYE